MSDNTADQKSEVQSSQNLPGSLAGQTYVLRLYISGATPKSTSAISNIKAICQKYLAGRYDLEVIDIYQQPASAHLHNIVVAPTLIRELPLPLRRLVGDLSNQEKVLVDLDLEKV